MRFTTTTVMDGDELAIVIPSEVMEILGVEVGDELSFTVKDGHIIIARAKDTDKVIANTDIGI